MEERVILIVSLVRDMTDGTLLVIREKNIESILHACRRRESFPMGLKQIGENTIQCAIRETFEKTGIVIQNPKEVAQVKMEMHDEEKTYEIVFFLSTEFSGSLHTAKGTDVVWVNPNEVKLDGQLLIQAMPQILAGRYLSGTYNYADDEFTEFSVRDL